MTIGVRIVLIRFLSSKPRPKLQALLDIEAQIIANAIP